MDRYQHILGGLYGQALGDAWAMPALDTPELTWTHYGGWIDRLIPSPASHLIHPGFPAGRVTDDTEQAFALAEEIIADGGVTIEGTARAVIRWYESVGGEACPYIGPSTRRAVQRMKGGEDLHVTGARGDTNGGAMRVSVVGLLHPGDPDAAVRDAITQCIPTHNTGVAMAGAAAIAAAVAVALRPGATLAEIIAAGSAAAEEGRRVGPPWLGASIPRRIALALEIARKPLPPREVLQDLYDLVGSTLAMTESVPVAFGVLALAEGDPVRTATYAAALSGDADTVGAMACAIAGAWRGAGEFPADAVQTLHAANPTLDFAGVARGLMELGERRA